MDTDPEFELLGEIRRLAHDMLRIDLAIQDATIRHKYTRVGELSVNREAIREHRSALMRDLFLLRRFKRASSTPGRL